MVSFNSRFFLIAFTVFILPANQYARSMKWLNWVYKMPPSRFFVPFQSFEKYFLSRFQKPLTWTESILPKIFFSINSLMATTGGLYLFCFTTKRFLPAVIAAFFISAASAVVIHMGFSQSTCLPASKE